jgi:hypothetical protein
MNRLTLLLLPLALACSPAKADIGGDGDADGDTDADTDVDTDVDTDSGTDTAPPSALDGLYEVEIELSGTESTFGLADVCYGEGIVDIQGDARTPVNGDMVCSFVGVLDYLGPQSATLIGWIEDGEIVGTVSVDLLGEPLDDDFTAQVSGDTIRGGFDGEFPYEYEGFELNIEYEAVFTGDR